MIILGIDPGTQRIGYGLIRKDGSRTTLLEAGLIPLHKKTGAAALQTLKAETGALIRKWKPDVMGIEKLFFSKNRTTGIAVAEARGVILVTGAEHGLIIRECTPNEVKLGLTGYGSADKKSVLKMVRLVLGTPALELIDDASDALAIAMVVGQKIGLDKRTE